MNGKAQSTPLRITALATAVFIAALALQVAVVEPVAGRAAAPSASAYPSNPLGPATDPFTATMTVSPSTTALMPGDLLSVTISIDVAEGCQYPVFELGLKDADNEMSLFSYVDPPDDLVGPPVAMPFTFVLRAERPGLTRLQGLAYGERNCDDFWNWTYVSGLSGSVQVGEWPYRSLLPTVSGGGGTPR